MQILQVGPLRPCMLSCVLKDSLGILCSVYSCSLAESCLQHWVGKELVRNAGTHEYILIYFCLIKQFFLDLFQTIPMMHIAAHSSKSVRHTMCPTYHAPHRSMFGPKCSFYKDTGIFLSVFFIDRHNIYLTVPHRQTKV
jgi:hypothetical protein